MEKKLFSMQLFTDGIQQNYKCSVVWSWFSLVKVVIISDQLEKISDFMRNTINRGYSIGYVYGGYNHIKRENNNLYVHVREAMLIKDFITKLDENAFINIVFNNISMGKRRWTAKS